MSAPVSLTVDLADLLVPPDLPCTLLVPRCRPTEAAVVLRAILVTSLQVKQPPLGLF